MCECGKNEMWARKDAQLLRAMEARRASFALAWAIRVEQRDGLLAETNVAHDRAEADRLRGK